MQLDDSDSSDNENNKMPEQMFAASHSAAFPSQFGIPAGSSSGLEFSKLGKKAEKIAVSGRGGKAEDILALMG